MKLLVSFTKGFSGILKATFDFLKGVKGASINFIFAAAAWNLKICINEFLCPLILRIL